MSFVQEANQATQVFRSANRTTVEGTRLLVTGAQAVGIGKRLPNIVHGTEQKVLGEDRRNTRDANVYGTQEVYSAGDFRRAEASEGPGNMRPSDYNNPNGTATPGYAGPMGPVAYGGPRQTMARAHVPVANPMDDRNAAAEQYIAAMVKAAHAGPGTPERAAALNAAHGILTEPRNKLMDPTGQVHFPEMVVNMGVNGQGQAVKGGFGIAADGTNYRDYKSPLDAMDQTAHVLALKGVGQRITPQEIDKSPQPVTLQPQQSTPAKPTADAGQPAPAATGQGSGTVTVTQTPNLTAADGTQAKLYTGTDGKTVDEKKAPKIAANQVTEIQKAIGANPDGKWGPETQAKFEAACAKANVDPHAVDFTKRDNPQSLKVLAQLHLVTETRTAAAPAPAAPPAPAPVTASAPPVVTTAPTPAPSAPLSADAQLDAAKGGLASAAAMLLAGSRLPGPDSEKLYTKGMEALENLASRSPDGKVIVPAGEIKITNTNYAIKSDGQPRTPAEIFKDIEQQMTVNVMAAGMQQSAAPALAPEQTQAIAPVSFGSAPLPVSSLFGEPSFVSSALSASPDAPSPQMKQALEQVAAAGKGQSFVDPMEFSPTRVPDARDPAVVAARQGGVTT